MSFDPIDMPFATELDKQLYKRRQILLTVANKGPRKNPMKLTAIEAAMMFGTLNVSV